MEMRVGAGNSHGLDALIRDLALVRIQAVPLASLLFLTSAYGDKKVGRRNRWRGVIIWFYMIMVVNVTLNHGVLVRAQVEPLKH